ncbi:MAG: depolymerase [Magnetovibrionaceae bacterium]
MSIRVVSIAAAGLCAAAVFSTALSSAGAEPAKVALPGLSIDAEKVTVSGISSGAFMGNQFHVAHSDLVSGAGLVAGGLYSCATTIVTGDNIVGTASRALDRCMFETAPLSSLNRYTGYAEDFAKRGWIADTENLKGDKVYLFSGRADTTVKTATVELAADFYDHFDADVDLLTKLPDSDLRAAHSFVTKDWGNPCSEQGSPFINDCKYDQAGAIFQLLYEGANQAAANPASIISFDQTPYTDGDPKDISMWDTGYAYIPDSCKAEGADCGLHVAFHGCQQSAQTIGDDFYTKIGLNEWAEGTGTVVLYPQARSVENFFNPFAANPKGCWNWWGYTMDNRFPVRDGQQIAAVRKMVDQIMSAAR